ncbi:hypothetical protein ACHWQZ_G006392 [Mnemiopsis leidyi]
MRAFTWGCKPELNLITLLLFLLHFRSSTTVDNWWHGYWTSWVTVDHIPTPEIHITPIQNVTYLKILTNPRKDATTLQLMLVLHNHGSVANIALKFNKRKIEIEECGYKSGQYSKERFSIPKNGPAVWEITKTSSFLHMYCQDASNPTANRRKLVSIEYPEECLKYVGGNTEYVILNSIGIDVVSYKLPSSQDDKSDTLVELFVVSLNQRHEDIKMYRNLHDIMLQMKIE